MNIFGVLCLVAMPFLVGSYESMTETDLNVVSSLAAYFKVGFCVFRVEDRKGLASGEFHPARKNILTTSWTSGEIRRYIRDGVNSARLGGRTMVILRMNNKTMESLRKMSHSVSLSAVVWIMFAEVPLNLLLFRDVYIPFDCEFIYLNQNDFSLTEVYHTERDSDPDTFELGRWTLEDGLVLVSHHMFTRRNNLKGHTLKAIIKNNPPYVSVEKDEKGKSVFKGYLYEVLSELEFRINFRTEFPEKYFDKNPKEVLRSEDVDFAVARISNERSDFQYMDFSQPIDEAKYYMFGHRPGSELEWDSYLKPFSANTWLVNLGWMLSSSLALAILYRIAWDSGTSEREADYFIFTFSESLLTVFRAICMQGSDVTPRSNSCRLLFLSIYLTALVVTSAFSAALFSLLTIPKPKAPFNTLDEVLSNKKFKIGLPSDSDFHKIVEGFSDSVALSAQSRLIQKILESKEDIPLTPTDGLQRLCHDKTYIFVFDLPNVLYLMQNMTRVCQDKILPSGPALFTEYIGFAFKKDNPYKKLIDQHLIRMKNEGLLHRLLLNYWPPQIPTVQATWVRVTLSDISPILYMFALGAILGVVLLYTEKIFLRLRQKKSNVNSTFTNSHVFLNKEIMISNYSNSRLVSRWDTYDPNKGRELSKVN